MAAADFILDIEQRIKGEAASELERTQRAFDSAAGALKRFESAQMSADKALLATTAKLEAVRGKMAAAMEAGNTGAFWKAAAEAQKLEAAQARLAEKAAQAKAAFDAQTQVVESAGGALQKLAEDQRAAGAAAQQASDEAKALAEQQANLERHTLAAARAAEQQARALDKQNADLAAAEVKALADQQANLEKHTQAAARAAEKQAAAMQQQQSKAIADIDAKTQRMNGTMMAAAAALAVVAVVAAKAAWEIAKFVGAMVFAKKAKELEAIGGKLRKNLGDIFGGINLDPFIAALDKIADFFSVSTVSGKALKALFESMFQPMIDAAVEAFPKVERFMLGLVIGALKIGIAVKKASKEFGFDLGAFENWPEIGKVGEMVAYAVVGAFAAMALAVAAAAAPYYAVIDAIAQLKTGWDEGKKGLEEFVLQVGIIWGRLDFGAIATNLIDGFVKGIKAGIARAVAAVEQLATEAVNAAKNKLKVFSPSRVFEDIGGFVAEGFAGGVDDGAGMAQASMSAMVEPPDAPAFAGGSGGGAVVTFAAGSVVINAADGTDAADRFIERLTAALEGMGMQVGAPA
jgi:chemotaxis protein histidine kinase CheA